MFASNSPYSPFFTSGLLSHSILDGIRRGSLPTDNSKDIQPPFIFSRQPEYRSFLSLDLAESQSMRSASFKRKPSSPFNFPKISEPSNTLRLRVSRDSLRSIPSPKPAPSITLPELPKRTPSPISSVPPRLPSLVPIPALEFPLPSLTISRTPAPLTVIRHISVATKATSSTISTRVRRSNRLEALARLEGRSKNGPITIHSKPAQQRNFMNMSDDEDEEDKGGDLDTLDLGDHTFPNPILEPEDVVLPTLSSPEAPRSSPLPPRPNDPFLVTSVRCHRTQLSSTKDWFPLKSFMDLHNDDDSSAWTWRSFIHVANLS
ncbi:hypothetical protein BYT27DRAFT_7216612 [Phlegmacium glaucopus]|nr:hypothetical protein BYT27DRAFT_7216612 [Phlegmacium glaucopus]